MDITLLATAFLVSIATLEVMFIILVAIVFLATRFTDDRALAIYWTCVIFIILLLTTAVYIRLA
jgi:integral membrane sensor domain MASE1